jgi:Tfp pilus assembly protein PilF
MTQTGSIMPDPGAATPRPEQRFSLRETGRILEVPEARLRRLARAGLLAPQRGPMGPLSFGFRDLLLLRTTKDLLDSGVPMRRIRRVWASLRRQLEAGAPLTSITVRAAGDRVVASDGLHAWQPDSGQVLLDFEAGGPAGRGTVSEARRETTIPSAGASDAGDPAKRAVEPTAEELCDRAAELETSAPAAAMDLYRRALELDPGLADAHVNLGRLYHRTNEPGRAEAHYRDAVRAAPDDPVPHFNLGVLLEDLGHREEAALAYRQALKRDPEFTDAHCNLGLLLESLGRRQEAVRHLMAARISSEAPE